MKRECSRSISKSLEKPSIIFISPTFGTSGGEVRLLECIKYWVNSGYFKDLHVVTTKRGVSVLKDLGPTQIKTYELLLIPENQHYFFSRSYFSTFLIKMVLSIFMVLKLFKSDIKVDVVYSPSHFLHDVLPSLIFSVIKRARLVVFIHHLSPSIDSRTRYASMTSSIFSIINDLISLKLIGRYASTVFTLPVVEGDVISRGVPKSKVIVTSNGVNVKYISSIPSSRKTYDASFLGRLVPLKGIFDLISIWEQVCSHFPDAKLVIIGEGPSRHEHEMKKIISEKKLSRNIIFRGFLPEIEKYSELKVSKLFLFPSYEEGWGITIMEAMACSAKVIAYDLPVYKTFGDAITRVRIGDKEAFSKEVIRLMNNKEILEKDRKKALIKAAEFDLTSIAQNEFNSLFNNYK